MTRYYQIAANDTVYPASNGPAREHGKPVTVLDLDDPHLLVADLRDAADEFEHRFIAPEAAARLSLLADQIEAQTRPPKPEEPRCLGAVVEDAEGRRWVRHSITPGSFPWIAEGRGGEGWSNIAAVRVLSEGVA